jgi:HNH endonuclease
VNGSLRRPKFRQCAYCLGEFPRAQITNDHIIAGSWYPDTTPSAVQRWTVPACRRCNNHFSSIERYVHARLAACVDPTHPAAAGMWEKARNSIDPKQARTPREREHRIRQREAFWSGLRELRESPPQVTRSRAIVVNPSNFKSPAPQSDDEPSADWLNAASGPADP